MRIFTIGFTKKTAEEFFTQLASASIKRLIDVRLNNTSQLAGFSKSGDLRYFLKAICNIDYIHLPELAPTQLLLDTYRKRDHDWDTYAVGFVGLMSERRIAETLKRDLINDSCLLCSEFEPVCCHRRLVAEYFRDCWGDMEIIHL